MPAFEYRQESLTAVAGRLLIVWAGLLLMCAIPILLLRGRNKGGVEVTRTSSANEQEVSAKLSPLS